MLKGGEVEGGLKNVYHACAAGHPTHARGLNPRGRAGADLLYKNKRMHQCHVRSGG